MKRCFTALVSACFVAACGGAGEPAPAPRAVVPTTYSEAVALALKEHKPLVAWRGIFGRPKVTGAIVYQTRAGDPVGSDYWLIVPWLGRMWELNTGDEAVQKAVDYINAAPVGPVLMMPPATIDHTGSGVRVYRNDRPSETIALPASATEAQVKAACIKLAPELYGSLPDQQPAAAPAQQPSYFVAPGPVYDRMNPWFYSAGNMALMFGGS